MHIPTGFLEPKVWIPMCGLSAIGVGVALKNTGEILDERKTPMMGVLAGFIFAAQMVNFPVLGGTSGHLIGAALAVSLLGLWPAMVVMTAVILMQALLFQDGGIEALGANIFNMGIAACLVSDFVITLGRRFGEKAYYPSVIIAGWVSVLAASALCAIQLALSGLTPFAVVVPAMTIIHAVIGIFEGIITVAALRFIIAVNPSLKYVYQGGIRRIVPL